MFTNDDPLNATDPLGLKKKVTATKITISTKPPTGAGAKNVYGVVPETTDDKMTITFTTSSPSASISVQNNGSMGNGLEGVFGNEETVTLVSNFGGASASATQLAASQVDVFSVPSSDAQFVNDGEQYNYSVTITISGAATLEGGENTVAVWTSRRSTKPVYGPRSNKWW